MRAIVAGGGIGGLSTATGLRLAGLDVEVFERTADPARSQVGGGFHLWPNGVRAMAQLGLEEKARGIGAVIDRTEFQSWRGKRLAVWDLHRVAAEVGSVDLGVSRADLLRVLYEAAGPEIVHAGAEVTRFEEDPHGVSVFFADGRCERADFLVGADGLRSTVRAQLLGRQDPQYAGYTQWQTITADASLLEAGLERICFGPGSRTVLHRVGGAKLFWAAVVYGKEDGAGKPPGRKTMLLRSFHGWPEPIEALIEDTSEEEIVGLAIYDRKPVRRWSSERVSLLGDAAHPMTTNTSQGGNQAIEDAVVLARCVEGATDVAAALKRYEAERRERTARLVKRSHQAAKMNAWRDPVRTRVRDAIFSVGLPGPALRDLRKNASVEF